MTLQMDRFEPPHILTLPAELRNMIVELACTSDCELCAPSQLDHRPRVPYFAMPEQSLAQTCRQLRYESQQRLEQKVICFWDRPLTNCEISHQGVITQVNTERFSMAFRALDSPVNRAFVEVYHYTDPKESSFIHVIAYDCRPRTYLGGLEASERTHNVSDSSQQSGNATAGQGPRTVDYSLLLRRRLGALRFIGHIERVEDYCEARDIITQATLQLARTTLPPAPESRAIAKARIEFFLDVAERMNHPNCLQDILHCAGVRGVRRPIARTLERRPPGSKRPFQSRMSVGLDGIRSVIGR